MGTPPTRHFLNARTPQDYLGVGSDCVHVTEAMSRLVYDSSRHLWEGEQEPSMDKTKQLDDDAYASHMLGGYYLKSLRVLMDEGAGKPFHSV